MPDSTFLKQIRKMTDGELAQRTSNTYMTAYYESYGSDWEAKADAIQRYEALVHEMNRRRRAGTALRNNSNR